MLTSLIKPPLPSTSPCATLPAPAPFFLPACHLDLPAWLLCPPPPPRETAVANPRLLRCSSRDSPAAAALSAAQPMLIVFLLLAFIMKKFGKKRAARSYLPQCRRARPPLRHVAGFSVARRVTPDSRFIREGLSLVRYRENDLRSANRKDTFSGVKLHLGRISRHGIYIN